MLGVAGIQFHATIVGEGIKKEPWCIIKNINACTLTHLGKLMYLNMYLLICVYGRRCRYIHDCMLSRYAQTNVITPPGC